MPAPFFYFVLTLLLLVSSSCSPLPKEGDSGYQLTLQLQTRSSERIGRSNSYNLRKSEFAALVPAGTTFNETGAGTSYPPSQVSLSNNRVSFTNVSAGNYDLFLYRYDTDLSSFPATAAAIDYGISQSSLSIPPSTSPVSVTIQLQKEVAVIDSAIQGLNYNAGGRSGITDADGLLYYFPRDASVTLSLGNLTLETTTGDQLTSHSAITPYNLFGIEEGLLADNVTNFARLLLTLDNDSNAENGIQLTPGSVPTSLTSLNDFSVDNDTFSSTVSGLSLKSSAAALQHLHESMRRKNLGLTQYFQHPEPGKSHVALDSIIAIAFAEPLRNRSVDNQSDNQSIQVSDVGSQTPLSGRVFHQANRLWFVPSAQMSLMTEYTVKLSDQLRGQSGSAPPVLSWNFTTGYHVDNGTADAVRQWLLNSSSVSSGSTGASLQHKGRYLDNLTNTQLVVLEIGNGGSEFHLAEGSTPPAAGSTGWRTSAFYPVEVPLTLSSATKVTQDVRVWYRDNASVGAHDNKSVSITLDRTPPYGWITLPKKTNQLGLPFLVMAGDHQSKAWRYLITNGANSVPTVDLEQWQSFPNNGSFNRQSWLRSVQDTDIRFQCFGSSQVEQIKAGTIHQWDPSATCASGSQLLTTQQAALEQALPAWDNISFSWSTTPSNGDNETRVLWLQDQAGNVSWGYPFNIQYDNQTPSSPVSFELVNLVTSAGQLQATLKLNASSSEYPLFFLIKDNDDQPDPYDSSWTPIDPGTHSGAGSFAISGSGSSTTLKTWIRDEAGNLALLNPESSFQTAKLVAGETLVNSGSPIHRYSALGVDFGQNLSAPGSYVHLLDNQTNQVVPIKQWNKDNTTTWRLWLEGPLQPSRAYTLRIDNFTQSGHSYLAQEFSFQTSTEDIDLSEGLVAYYSFDNNTLDQSGNNLDGSKVGAVSFTTDRFGQADRSIELSGNSEYITVAHYSKLNLDNLTISAWINADNISGLTGIVSKYNQNPTPILLRINEGKLNVDHQFESIRNLTIQRWYHLTMTRQGNNTTANIKLCIDGISIESNGETPGDLSGFNNNDLRIGSDYGSRYFNGKIDEVRIYDRALSQAEIEALYSTADPNPLTFESSTPTNNASGVMVTDNITISFNKPLDSNTLQSINFDLRRSDNLSFAGNVYPVSSDNKSVVFDPVEDLSSMDNYTLHFKPGIRDYLGNALTPAQINFQTQLLGDGSVASPYLINSESGLRKMHDNLTGHYLLTNNIVLNQNWNPIGWDNTTPSPFSGSLDGDNHTIFNLTIDNDSSNNIGFFSNLSGNVSDVKFKDLLINGHKYIGTIAGKQNNTSIISNIIFDNLSVHASGNRVGGVAGEALGNFDRIGIYKINILALSSSRVGGLIGSSTGSLINESFVTGQISGSSPVGGLIGRAEPYSKIINSYSLINSGVEGGLIGTAAGSNGSNEVTNSYALNKLIGTARSNIYDNSNYFDNNTATTVSSIGEGRSTVQLQKTLVDNGTVDGQQTYNGWDFVNVWDAGSACEYPRLRWQNEPLRVSCLLHGGSANSTSVGRTQDIQIGFNRPVDNMTLTYGPSGNIQLNPYIVSDNISLSYDNNTQMLTIQRSFPIDNNSSYNLSFQNIKSANQQNTLVPYAHSFTAHQPGLVYETWHCPSWSCPKSSTNILSSGIFNANLSVTDASGPVKDALGRVLIPNNKSDYFVIRLLGYFTMPGTNGVQYDVSFYNNDDDGTVLKIGLQTLVDRWGDPKVNETYATTRLIGGQTYYFERFFSEWTGGARLVQKWKISGIHDDYVFMNGQNDFFHYSN